MPAIAPQVPYRFLVHEREFDAELAAALRRDYEGMGTEDLRGLRERFAPFAGAYREVIHAADAVLAWRDEVQAAAVVGRARAREFRSQ